MGTSRWPHTAATIATLPSAVEAPLPAKLAPQLATLLKRPPSGDAWTYEAKLDGYRILARVEDDKVRLITRNGNDWIAKMPALAKEVAALGLRSAWIDGEIVVMRADGVPDFNALQNAMDASKAAAVSYFVFDHRPVPALVGAERRPRIAEAFGEDDIAKPALERKQRR